MPLCDHSWLFSVSELLNSSQGKGDCNQRLQGIFRIPVHVRMVIHVKVDSDCCSTASSTRKTVYYAGTVCKDDSQPLQHIR